MLLLRSQRKGNRSNVPRQRLLPRGNRARGAAGRKCVVVSKQYRGLRFPMGGGL